VLVRAHGFAIQRGVAEHVIVELDVRAGLPAFSVIGLAGAAARDARERVQAAVLNSGLSVPRRRVTVNLAPASSRRSGSEFDLAIACCVVAADGLIDPQRLGRVGLIGELGLGGLLRQCTSPAGAAVAVAAEADLEMLIVPNGDLDEARAAGALPVVGPANLGQVVELLAAPAMAPLAPRRSDRWPRSASGGEPPARRDTSRPITGTRSSQVV
jgi:magnesium chelatase family protein